MGNMSAPLALLIALLVLLLGVAVGATLMARHARKANTNLGHRDRHHAQITFYEDDMSVPSFSPLPDGWTSSAEDTPYGRSWVYRDTRGRVRVALPMREPEAPVQEPEA
jgi:hypothetical protein